ncbi:MAG: hypothetical protein ACXIUO_00850 [Erythrobacter sp.]
MQSKDIPFGHLIFLPEVRPVNKWEAIVEVVRSFNERDRPILAVVCFALFVVVPTAILGIALVFAAPEMHPSIETILSLAHN